MRAIAVVVLACLAIGTYGKSLEELKLRMLVELLEEEVRQQGPPPKCDSATEGNVLPPNCDEDAGTCKCECEYDEDTGEYYWDDADNGICPDRPERPKQCDAGTFFPPNCGGDDKPCQCECEEDDGKYRWEDADGEICAKKFCRRLNDGYDAAAGTIILDFPPPPDSSEEDKEPKIVQFLETATGEHGGTFNFDKPSLDKPNREVTISGTVITKLVDLCGLPLEQP